MGQKHCLRHDHANNKIFFVRNAHSQTDQDETNPLPTDKFKFSNEQIWSSLPVDRLTPLSLSQAAMGVLEVAIYQCSAVTEGV